MKRSRFKVPYIALDTGQSKRFAALGAAERIRNGVSFDAVANDCTGGVGLDVIKVFRLAIGPGYCRPHQTGLRVTGWRGDIPAAGKALRMVCSSGGIDRG